MSELEKAMELATNLIKLLREKLPQLSEREILELASDIAFMLNKTFNNQR